MAVELAVIGDEAAPAAVDQIRTVQVLGWRAIELRTIGGRPLAQLGARAFRELVALVRDAGLCVVAVSTGIGGWGRSTRTPLRQDMRELETVARRMHALGAPYARIMSFAAGGLGEAEWRREALRRVGALAIRAHQLGVTLVHENCAGWAGRGARETLELVHTVDSPGLRLLFDTGNGLSYGYDAPAFLRQVLPWVSHVHVKDGVAGRGDTRWVTPGAGDAGVAECLRMLLAEGYAGAVVLEPHLAITPHAGHYRAQSPSTVIAAGRALEALIKEQCSA